MGAIQIVPAVTSAPLWTVRLPAELAEDVKAMASPCRVPVLSLLKVRLPVPPESPSAESTADEVVLKAEPLPSTVTVPLPSLPSKKHSDETLPPEVTLVVLPPFSPRSRVVDRVDPLPLTLMAFEELKSCSPVITTSPPLEMLRALPDARLKVPVASRVSCPPLRLISPLAV